MLSVVGCPSSVAESEKDKKFKQLGVELAANDVQGASAWNYEHNGPRILPIIQANHLFHGFHLFRKEQAILTDL